MYCKKCGKLISDNATQCPFCGAQQSNKQELTVGGVVVAIIVAVLILAFL